MAILNDVKYSISSSLDLFNVIMFTQKRAPRQTFNYSKSTIETLKNNCKISSKLTIKTPGWPSSLFIANFKCISLLFLVFCCWLGVPPYKFINAEITYCCNYWQMYKNLSKIIRKDCDPCSKVGCDPASTGLQKSHSFMVNLLIWQFRNSDCKYSLSIVNVLEEFL